MRTGQKIDPTTSWDIPEYTCQCKVWYHATLRNWALTTAVAIRYFNPTVNNAKGSLHLQSSWWEVFTAKLQTTDVTWPTLTFPIHHTLWLGLRNKGVSDNTAVNNNSSVPRVDLLTKHNLICTALICRLLRNNKNKLQAKYKWIIFRFQTSFIHIDKRQTDFYVICKACTWRSCPQISSNTVLWIEFNLKGIKQVLLKYVSFNTIVTLNCLSLHSVSY